MAVILVVDDRAINRQFLITLLSYGGHQLYEAVDGVDAFQCAKEIGPDLIISDILMPNMDGFEFVKHLRATPRTAQIPIIFYTASHQEQEARAVADACHVRWVLTKPTEPERILQTVNEALGCLKDPPAEPADAAEADESPAEMANSGESAFNHQLLEYLGELKQANQLMLKLANDEQVLPHDRAHLHRTVLRLNDSISSLQSLSLRTGAMVELGIELARTREPEQLLEITCRALQGICVAKYAAIGIPDNTGQQWTYFASRGLGQQAMHEGAHIDPCAAIYQTLLGSREPYCAKGPDSFADDLKLPRPRSTSFSVLGVSVRSRERVYGWLYVAEKLGAADFNVVDRHLVAMMAAQLATAYENLQLYDEIRSFTRVLQREVSARIATEARLQHLANHDALTDLANRNLLQDRLNQGLAHARRHKNLLALMFIDLDRFKVINDSLGHVEGDRLLKEIATQLSGLVREGDTVARPGGDEFIILLPDLENAADVIAISLKVLNLFATPFKLGDKEIFITASLGVSLYPNDGTDAEALTRCADTAMFRAKEESGNTYRFYDTEMGIYTRERLKLETDLRRALERLEFDVFYQPQFEVHNRTLIGAEALIRWRHPELGLIPPAQFIPIAEELGVILPIGEWVLKTVCEQCKRWQKEGLVPIRVSVNLSAKQVQHFNFLSAFEKILHDSALDPHFLELEITESLMMHDTEKYIALLNTLKALGISLSIDDFGTGFSSLSYLKRFPIARLKIDQSFVRDIVTDPNDAAITVSIITLGHSLNMKVIAEGVETLEQFAFLAKHQCDEIQGYYLSCPLPVSEMTTLLRKSRDFCPSPTTPHCIV